MRIKSFSLTLVLTGAVLGNGALRAQEHQHDHHKEESKVGHSHAKAEIHGGDVMMPIAHHFEVVWMLDHVMVYLYDLDQKPLAAKGVTGEIVFAFKDKQEEKATLNLMEAGKMMEEHPSDEAEHPSGKTDAGHDQMAKEEMEAMHKLMSNQDHFMAKVNLENVKEGDVKATFTLKGLPGKDESVATFSSKFKMMSLKHHDVGHEKHEQHH